MKLSLRWDCCWLAELKSTSGGLKLVEEVSENLAGGGETNSLSPLLFVIFREEEKLVGGGETSSLSPLLYVVFEEELEGNNPTNVSSPW